MNEGQKVFRRYLLKGVEGHQGDIMQAIIWCQNHFGSQLRSERMAIQRLSSSERNAVIREILLGMN